MRKAILILSLFCSSWAMYATTLHVEALNTSDLYVAVQTIGKIVIKGTTLEFYDREGNMLYTSSMGTMSAITFEDPQSIFESSLEQYAIYPNPTHSVLMVKGLTEPVALRLYNMDGKLTKSTVGTQLDVQDVQNGNYLLQFNNQIVKIIKQ